MDSRAWLFALLALLLRFDATTATPKCEDADLNNIFGCFLAKNGMNLAQANAAGLCTLPSWQLIGGYGTTLAMSDLANGALTGERASEGTGCTRVGCISCKDAGWSCDGVWGTKSLAQCTAAAEAANANSFTLSGETCCYMSCPDPETAITEPHGSTTSYVLRHTAAPACVPTWRLAGVSDTCTTACASYGSVCVNSDYRAAIGQQDTDTEMIQLATLLTGAPTTAVCQAHSVGNDNWVDYPLIQWADATAAANPANPQTSCDRGHPDLVPDCDTGTYARTNARRVCYCSCPGPTTNSPTTALTTNAPTFAPPTLTSAWHQVGSYGTVLMNRADCSNRGTDQSVEFPGHAACQAGADAAGANAMLSGQYCFWYTCDGDNADVARQSGFVQVVTREGGYDYTPFVKREEPHPPFYDKIGDVGYALICDGSAQTRRGFCTTITADTSAHGALNVGACQAIAEAHGANGFHLNPGIGSCCLRFCEHGATAIEAAAGYIGYFLRQSCHNPPACTITSGGGDFVPARVSQCTQSTILATRCEVIACLWKPELCTRLSLADKSLTGTIPSELGLLTALTAVYLQRNSLTGALPTELGSWMQTTVVDLSGNSGLTGTVPAELSSVTIGSGGSWGV